MLKQITKPDGKLAWCEHTDCKMPGVRIVARERPSHAHFKGAAHYCCARHSLQRRTSR